MAKNSLLMVKCALVACAAQFAFLSFFSVATALGVEVKAVDALTVIYDRDRAVRPFTIEMNEELDGLVTMDDYDRIYRSLEELPDAGAVRMAGPRNGRCSGMAVVWGEGAGKVSVEMGLLSSGDNVLPEEAVEVRFLGHSGLEEVYETRDAFQARYHRMAYYDRLLPAPDEDAVLVPVWIRVVIPDDTEPGLYTGTLKIGDEEIPVELKVSAWRFPDPADFTVHNAHLLHSPETLARYYDVPMWSDEHIEKIERSLHYLGLLGNRGPVITAQHRTHMGEGDPMIVFRAGDDGEYAPDFTPMNRYLDAYARQVQVPDYVTLFFWEPNAGVSRGASVDSPARRGGHEAQEYLVLTREEDGGTRDWGGSIFQDEEFVHGFLEAFRAQIHERGWEDAQIILGMIPETEPRRDVIEQFGKLAPWAKWTRFSHYRGEPTPGPEDERFFSLGYIELPFREEPFWHSGRGGSGGWDIKFPRMTNNRRPACEYVPLTQFYNMFDYTVGGAGTNSVFNGITRWSLDYWEIDGRSLWFFPPIGSGRWALMYRPWKVKQLLAPGPDGPVSTTRLEMLLEGLQETEARIVLEKALRNDELPEERREEIRELLARRQNYRWRGGRVDMGPRPVDMVFSRIWGVAPDRVGVAHELYELAAAVEEFAE